MVSRRRLFNARGHHAEVELDAGLRERIAHADTHILVKPTQQIFAPRGKGHFGAKPRENAREFHRDIAAADNQHTPWQFREIEHFV